MTYNVFGGTLNLALSTLALALGPNSQVFVDIAAFDQSCLRRIFTFHIRVTNDKVIYVAPASRQPLFNSEVNTCTSLLYFAVLFLL